MAILIVLVLEEIHHFTGYLQFLTKYLENSKKIKQKWTRIENVDTCICVTFDRHYKYLIFLRGDYALGLGT